MTMASASNWHWPLRPPPLAICFPSNWQWPLPPPPLAICFPSHWRWPLPPPPLPTTMASASNWHWPLPPPPLAICFPSRWQWPLPPPPLPTTMASASTSTANDDGLCLELALASASTSTRNLLPLPLAMASASTSTRNLLPLPLAMASASTSTAVNSGYQVFLNHRGLDTKKTLASHLYRRLFFHRFQVFWDKEEMQVGDTITSQIQDAIKTASVHVAIFSPRYAESSWCLDELYLMVESGKPIISLFYGVHPTELRRTHGEGVYAQALRNHEKKRTSDSQPRYDSTIIKNWRTALSTVAGMSGLELDKFNGDEGELVDKAVDSVWQKLRKNRFDVAEHPTGLDEKIEDFKNRVLLQRQTGKPQVIGIVGFGGIGKTTLVQELFNRKSSNYHRSCFLSEVREDARKNSLFSLQTKLLKALTQMDVQIESVNEGITLLKTHLSSCLALVILDDVDLVDNYLEACNRLPLSLKVFGALLYGNHEKSFWEDHLERLQQILPDDIQKSLQISYDALQMDEKQIFLDIACCLVGNDRDTAITIWDGCGLKGSLVFRSLQNKNLVELYSPPMDSFGIRTIGMHDHLRDLGRKLAKDPGLPRRIFRVEDIDDLSQQSGVTEVRGIRTNWKFPSFKDCKMKNLQLLHIDYTGKDDSLKSLKNAVQSPNLIWLSLWNCDSLAGACNISNSDSFADVDPLADYTFADSDSYLSSWIPLTKLRVLEVSDCLGGLWQEEWQAPLQLRVLDISGHLFPKSIGLLKHLERVVIYGEIVIFRESFPEDICHLLSLKFLKIRCGGRSLPDSLGNLTKLQYLDLEGSSELERLPHSFGNLTNLKHINLSDCLELEQLPDTFENLKRLEFLDLSECEKLKQLPDNFENLRGLKYVDLTGCDDLTMSIETLGNIVTLEFIYLPSHLLEAVRK